MRSSIITFIILCLLVSCQNHNNPDIEHRPDKTTHFDGQQMTMNYHIIIAKELSNKEITQIASIIKETFAEIDAVYNKWNPHSEISRLNQADAHIEIPLSAQLEKLLTKAYAIAGVSGGRFDPTIEPLQELWKKNLEAGRIPQQKEIEEIAPAIGWDKVRFGSGTFSKSHPKTSLDLGGIAKGFCVDMLVERINKLGFLDVYVEWGGEIRTSGRHSNERPWTVFISRLGNADPSKAITLVALENRALATSGDYLQNWSVDISESPNKHSPATYFHIFDVETLMPLESTYTSIASASVASLDCAFADGLATAAMTFSELDAAKEWAEKISGQFPETTFWFMTREHVGQLP